MINPAWVLIWVAALSACTNMSGLDAQSKFSCKAPDGILCESMSGIYANAQAKNLPGQRVNQHGLDNKIDLPSATVHGVLTQPIYSGMPIRSAPRMLRVWFAPWEDTDGDLHDQSYVYLPIDAGRWLIEHNRDRIQESYRPARVPTHALTQHALGIDGVSTPQPHKDKEVIGIRQDRLNHEQGAALLQGINGPDDITPSSESGGF